MNHSKLLPLKPLALMLATVFPAIATATPTVSASGFFNIIPDDPNSGIFAKSASFTQAPTMNPFNQTYVGSAQSYVDSSAGVVAISNGAGSFGSSIENTVVWNQWPSQTAETHMLLSDTITNTGSSAKNVTFDINIQKVLMTFSSTIIGLYSGNSPINMASMAASVKANGVVVWSSAFSANQEIQSGTNPFVVTSSGTDVGLVAAAAATVCNDSWSCNITTTGFFQSLNLGSLAPNASLTVDYAVDLFTETNTYGGSSSVYFDDPAGLASGSSGNPSGSLYFASSNTVPEPGSASLLAASLGLLGALGTRRRRRNKL